MVAIPSLFTCLNLFFGCLGIIYAFNEHLMWSAFMVGLAALADFVDGFAARLLKAESAFGKQLDSLADMVTFGVLPEWRRSGLDALLIAEVSVATDARGWAGVECSWVLEDNRLMIQALERLGGRPYRRYRLYEKAL